ncbi:MAG: EamA family transporter, partial [Patescibacteria group bacterium]|nr:EamA family transporter [Patescibacteria group bacterium]
MWLLLSLTSAITVSIYSILNKQLTKSLPLVIFLFVSNLSTLIFMFVMIMFMGGIPHVTSKFYLFMFISSLMDLVSFIAYTYAFKNHEISLLTPLRAFIPAIATLVAFFALHEIPTPLKMLGVLVIVCGAYVLNISDARISLLTPLKKLFSNRGVQIYSIMVILFGIAPIFQKQAIFQTEPITPLYASFFGTLLVTVYFGIYVFRSVKKELPQISKSSLLLLVYGLIYTIGQLTSYLAFSKANVGYVTGVSNLSILFSIILGGVLLKEQRIK